MAVIIRLPEADSGSNLHLLASVNTDTSLFHKDVICGLLGSKGRDSAVVAGFSDYLVHLVVTDFN